VREVLAQLGKSQWADVARRYSWCTSSSSTSSSIPCPCGFWPQRHSCCASCVSEARPFPQRPSASRLRSLASGFKNLCVLSAPQGAAYARPSSQPGTPLAAMRRGAQRKQGLPPRMARCPVLPALLTLRPQGLPPLPREQPAALPADQAVGPSPWPGKGRRPSPARTLPPLPQAHLRLLRLAPAPQGLPRARWRMRSPW